MKTICALVLTLWLFCGFGRANAEPFSYDNATFNAGKVSALYSKGFASAVDDSLAVILGITNNDIVTVDNLRVKLMGVNGIKLICYDSNLGVFVVDGLHNIYNSKNEIFNACQKAVGDTRLYLKTGSAKEIVSQCPFSNFNDPDAIKGFLNN